MSKYTSDQLFDLWLNYVRENDNIRYIHKERLEIVGELASSFKSGDISYEEALSYLKKVVLALTTEEGRKGKGKHAGWKECVEDDYRGALASEYVELDSPKKEEQVQESNILLIEDPWIDNWLKAKFGKVPSEITKLAHTPGSYLNVQFLIETFSSKWIFEAKEPNWRRI
ncbi:MAG TPA: hypothetical protein VI911_12065 [Patescibacteria group bacterium]|nr:hypothetical protein [Patescibacteria group bacterium]